MIGKFKEAENAKEAMAALESIRELAEEERLSGILNENSRNYSKKMLDTIISTNVHGISPRDLLQLCQDVNINHEGNVITIKTNETDVSAFITLLISKCAKIEIFSTHNYSE